MMRSMVFVAFFTLLGGCSKQPSQEQCDALKLHIAELVLSEKAGSDTIESAGKLVGLLDDNARTYCKKEISKKRVLCALAAKKLEQAKKCDD